MGCSSSQLLDADTLEEYQDCTFFTKREIIHVFERYRALGGTQEGTLPMDKVCVNVCECACVCVVSMT